MYDFHDYHFNIICNANWQKQILVALVFAVIAALALALQSADPIVSEQPTAMHGDYQGSFLVEFFTIVCSALLVTLVIHYYRMQWGRKSILAE